MCDGECSSHIRYQNTPFRFRFKRYVLMVSAFQSALNTRYSIDKSEVMFKYSITEISRAKNVYTPNSGLFVFPCVEREEARSEGWQVSLLYLK